MSENCIQAIHHVEFHVNNALQSAFWYCCNFGFRRFATRRRGDISEVAIRNGDVILVFKCALKPNCCEVDGAELAVHGDFVKDVAFSVDYIHTVVQRIREISPKIVIQPPTVFEDGVTMARVHGSSASVIHTLIQKPADYRGVFLPGFTAVDDYALSRSLVPTSLACIDHVVEGHAEGATDGALEWYAKALALHRFWSIDDKSVFTEYSALRASIVANADRNVQFVVVEPVRTDRDFRGQVQEYLDHNGGPGIQHMAFNVIDICAEVARLRARGVEFLHIPNAYYDELEKRLASSNVKIVEDLQMIRELKLLLDFDDNGYLLQTFTKPMQDRPTFFIEIIQRHNFNGFGAGNFKALFAAVEREQQRRAEETLSDNGTPANETNGTQSNGVHTNGVTLNDKVSGEFRL